MRWIGVGLLICGLAASGAAEARRGFGHTTINTCYTDKGVAYKPGDWCYSNCAPAGACYLEVCYSDGSLIKVFPCKQRDCRKQC